MLINTKLMSGEFMLGVKNGSAAAQQRHNLQPPSPPMPALDFYSAYAYQHQLQQQLLNSHMTTANHMHQQTGAAEVLDLSRRELADFVSKTPSPNRTSSSLGSGSSTASPVSIIDARQAPPPLSSDLLYAAQAYQQAQNVNNLSIGGNLAALYPRQYYPIAAKREPIARTLSPPKTMPMSPPAPGIANNNNNNSLLKTFASVAAVAATATATGLKKDVSAEPHSPQSIISEIRSASTPSSSSSSSSSCTSHLASHDLRITRPFKAFPRDPLVIAANFAATDILLDNPHSERYAEYRKRVLEEISSCNGGSRTVTNPKMRRTNLNSGSVADGCCSNNSENGERRREESSDCDSNSGQGPQMSANAKSSKSSNTNEITNKAGSAPVIVKDAAYYERRRKNNAAAKKSRDRRRIKEDEISIRAAYLERQNIELLCQVDALKAQLAALTAKMA